MIGKLLIDKKYYNGNAKDVYEEDPTLKFESGKEYLENYLAKDIIRLGVNWYGLPSVEEMLDELDEIYPKGKRVVLNKTYDTFNPVKITVD